MGNNSFNKYKFLDMTFYEVLKGTVNMIRLAEYFGYKVNHSGNISVYFGDKKKRRIHLDTSHKSYWYVKSEIGADDFGICNYELGKYGGDFVDLFINASQERFGEEFERWPAMKKIKRLLVEGEIKAYDSDYLYALKHFIHKKKPRGKDKAPRKKRIPRVDYEKPKRLTRWHPLESWEHYSDYNAE